MATENTPSKFNIYLMSYRDIRDEKIYLTGRAIDSVEETISSITLCKSYPRNPRVCFPQLSLDKLEKNQKLYSELSTGRYVRGKSGIELLIGRESRAKDLPFLLAELCNPSPEIILIMERSLNIFSGWGHILLRSDCEGDKEDWKRFWDFKTDYIDPRIAEEKRI